MAYFMFAKQKTFAFIDVENIRGAAHDAGYRDFDYEKLCEWLMEKHGASRVYFFAAVDDYDEERKKVFDRLRQISGCYIETKELMTYKTSNLQKAVSCPQCRHQFIKEIPVANRRKGNCDTELTLELMRHGIRKRYTHAIVFSGDGDFARVYEHLVNELKKRIVLFSPLGKFKNRTARKLKDLDRDGIISILPLNDLYDKFCIK